MKRALLFVLLLAAVVAGAFAPKRVDALGGGAIFKDVTLTIVVTPSPTPVGFTPRAPGRLIAQAERAPSDYETWTSGFVLPPPLEVAQANPQGNIPVKFATKADPSFAYLHFVNHTMVLNAPYGISTYTCAYEVYASNTSTWHVTDWVYGTGSSNANPTFPAYNAPTTDDLSWLAEGASAFNTYGNNFTPFYNNGSPGQTAFQSSPVGGGTAQLTQQRCIDLQLNVPSSIPAGTYSITVQYNLVTS